MPGQAGNPTIVSAFHTSLAHQVAIVGLVFLALCIVWSLLRTARRTSASPEDRSAPGRARVVVGPEPTGRRLLRIGFGLLWFFDGVLQLQTSMPLGLPGGVLQPAASSSPTWVQHLVTFGATVWSNHPVQAAVAAMWIQLGLGAFLLVAPRGRWSRLAGLIGLGWGLVVWIFGEAFGGTFAPGASWLFGAPGAAVFYCVGGALVALPERVWSRRTTARAILGGTGIFFVVMAILQAWPGRGFWQGATRGATRDGTLVAMEHQMAQISQPHLLSSWISAFGAFDGAHGWGVNLVVVVALAAVGAAFCTGNPRIVRPAVIVGVVLCLADWVLVEDLGFLGGVGTDPNSMIPMALVFVAGYLAMARLPAGAETPVPVPAQAPAPAPAPATASAGARTTRWWDRSWERLGPAYVTRTLASVGAATVVVLGAAPMALAATNPNADPILTEAVNGPPNTVNEPAPDFHLVDQHDRPVSLHSLRGRTIALTFLDPVCTTDCPLIAQEFRQADTMLGPDASKVALVAVVANPIDRSVAFTDAFDRQEGLDHVANWIYLTGSVPALSRVWDAYGVEVAVSPAGSMIAHSDLAYIIDGRGRTREVLSADPGWGPSSASSFASLLCAQLERVMRA